MQKQKKRKLSKREQKILYFTFFLISLILVIKIIIIPVNQKMREINRDIDKKALLLNRYVSLISQGENMVSLYENYIGSLKIEDRTEDEVIAKLYSEIEKTAKTFNLVIENIQSLPTKITNDSKEAFLEVEFDGEFGSIFQFINHLENLPLFIKVFSCKLFVQSGKNNRLRCKIIFSKLFF
ncbi:MAG: hypothetical protein KAJ79_00765 [Candidatus Omnitrophica bacterium]|nr:hypothetical protein [Candidatus Omnitrophota bacterium]